MALDRDHLDVFYYISASEIWPEKRSGLWWEITRRYLPNTCLTLSLSTLDDLAVGGGDISRFLRCLPLLFIIMVLLLPI